MKKPIKFHYKYFINIRQSRELMKRHMQCSWMGRPNGKMSVIPELIYKCKAIPNRIPTRFFRENWIKWVIKKSLKNKNTEGGFVLLGIRKCY